jgi:hypothetical protein
MTPWAGKPRLIAICYHAAKVEQNIHLLFVIIFPDLLYIGKSSNLFRKLY